MIGGPPNELRGALLMGAGWVINLAIAEWAIRKRPAKPGGIRRLRPSAIRSA
jgi:hypothetical protein